MTTTTELYPTDAIYLIRDLQKNVDRASTWGSTAQLLDITPEELKRARGLRESRGLDARFPYGFGRDGYLRAIDGVLAKYNNKYNALVDLEQFFKKRNLQLEICSEVLEEAVSADSVEITNERTDELLKRFRVGLARAFRNEPKPDASKR